MAFDTKDDRSAMVNLIGLPVPGAMPQAASGFTVQAAGMLLNMFPADYPTFVAELAGVAPSQITRVKLLGMMN